MYEDQQAGAGINFYTFPDKAPHMTAQWVNRFATDAHQKHIDIFDELEITRPTQKICSCHLVWHHFLIQRNKNDSR